MKRQKKIAVINDFSGFGRCSLTVSIPIISAMKIQCCALPTAILSNHTGYEDYFFDDYTDKMKAYYMKWEKLGLKFDGIYSGFLGSEKQAKIVEDFIERFSDKNTVVTVDPAMADNGKMYATIDERLCREMKNLIPLSHIITPNLTEACILTDTVYHDDEYTTEEIEKIAGRLERMGAKKIVITGIVKGENICNFVCDGDKRKMLAYEITGKSHAGTGDVFASVISADAVNGVDFEMSVRKSAEFVGKCVELSNEMEIPVQDGVCFEEILDLLM